MSQSFKDFFKDDNNVYSMSRLLVAGAFCLVAIVIISFTFKALFCVVDKEVYAHIANLCIAMLTAFVAQYGLGKAGETASKFSNKEVKNADIQQ